MFFVLLPLSMALRGAAAVLGSSHSGNQDMCDLILDNPLSLSWSLEGSDEADMQ